MDKIGVEFTNLIGGALYPPPGISGHLFLERFAMYCGKIVYT